MAISHANSELKDLVGRGLSIHFEPGAVGPIKDYLEREQVRARCAPDPRIRSYFEEFAEQRRQTQKYLALLRSIAPS